MDVYVLWGECGFLGERSFAAAVSVPASGQSSSSPGGGPPRCFPLLAVCRLSFIHETTFPHQQDRNSHHGPPARLSPSPSPLPPKPPGPRRCPPSSPAPVVITRKSHLATADSSADLRSPSPLPVSVRPLAHPPTHSLFGPPRSLCPFFPSCCHPRPPPASVRLTYTPVNLAVLRSPLLQISLQHDACLGGSFPSPSRAGCQSSRQTSPPFTPFFLLFIILLFFLLILPPFSSPPCSHLAASVAHSMTPVLKRGSRSRPSTIALEESGTDPPPAPASHHHLPPITWSFQGFPFSPLLLTSRPPSQESNQRLPYLLLQQDGGPENERVQLIHYLYPPNLLQSLSPPSPTAPAPILGQQHRSYLTAALKVLRKTPKLRS